MFSSNNNLINNEDSIWWKDLILVDKMIEDDTNYFSTNISCRLHNGRSISFKHSHWLGN